MKAQRLFKIESWGVFPSSVASIVSKYNGEVVTSDAIFTLDSDITFCVCDLREAHGNLNKYDKSAWLAPRNGDNSFNVTISF